MQRRLGCDFEFFRLCDHAAQAGKLGEVDNWLAAVFRVVKRTVWTGAALPLIIEPDVIVAQIEERFGRPRRC